MDIHGNHELTKIGNFTLFEARASHRDTAPDDVIVTPSAALGAPNVWQLKKKCHTFRYLVTSRP